MNRILNVFWLLLLCGTSGHAISREEYLKIYKANPNDYVPIVGVSSEFAISRDEFMRLSFEVRRTIINEQNREKIQYLTANVGKKVSELDPILAKPIGYRTKDPIVTYEDVGSLYAIYGDHFQAAEYFYKDFLEHRKGIEGKPAIWQAPDYVGDSDPALGFWYFIDSHKLYAIAFKRYIEYIQSIEYETTAVKKLAKTVKPKPLTPDIKNHERFYSDKKVEVLKALEYYYANKVRFMLEKALKHKDTVVAATAKEYIEKLDQGGKEGKGNK